MMMLWKLLNAFVYTLTLRNTLPSGFGNRNETSLRPSVWVNAEKDTFVTDYDKCLIKKVSACISTIFFGGGNDAQCQSTGDGESASLAGGRPYHLCGDLRTGEIYFTDHSTRVLRRISADGTMVSTVAGTVSTGQEPSFVYADNETKTYGSRHDEMEVTEAELDRSQVIATTHRFVLPSVCRVDKAGNVFIVDSGAGAVVKLTSSTGMLAVLSTEQLIAEGEVLGEYLTLPSDADKAGAIVKHSKGLLRGSAQ